VFVVDQFVVVSAGEIDAADLAQGGDRYSRLPRWRPQLVGVRIPSDPKEREKVTFSAFSGKDYSSLPAYYVPYEQTLPQVRQRWSPVSELEKRHPEAKSLVASAAAQLQIPIDKLVWVPVRHRKGFWTALLDPDTGRPVSWLPLDPY
jgi:hypothetical protein